MIDDIENRGLNTHHNPDETAALGCVLLTMAALIVAMLVVGVVALMVYQPAHAQTCTAEDLRPRMHKEEVARLCGAPYRITPFDGERWEYGSWWSITGQVQIFRNGLVDYFFMKDRNGCDRYGVGYQKPGELAYQASTRAECRK